LNVRIGQLIVGGQRKIPKGCHSPPRWWPGFSPRTVRYLSADHDETLYLNREPSALASLDVFRETVDTYRRVGITDMVVPFPGQAPFDTNMGVLEQVAGILSEL